MDATFVESDMYYSPLLSNSSLQGEIQDEQLNFLWFEWPSFFDTEIPVNEETFTQLDVSSDNVPPPWLDVPSDNDIGLKVEGILADMK